MSCRNSYGGRAASACATAIVHGNSQNVSRLIHELKREAESRNYNYSPSLEDVELLFVYYRNLVQSDDSLSEGRKERVYSSIEKALHKFRSQEEELPNSATFYAWANIADALSAENIVSQNSPASEPTHTETTSTSLKPYHKSFHNFHRKTIEATDQLFRKRPSRLTLEEAQEVFEEWVTQVSHNYNISVPKLQWNEEALDAGGGFYTRSSETIDMSHVSVTTLLHEYRHHMQAQGISMLYEDLEDDARAWSLSLYYKTRPNLFKRLVSEGKILHISPQEL